MMGLIIVLLSCQESQQIEVENCSDETQEIQRLNEQIDQLSSRNRNMSRKTDLLQDQLDLYRADLVDWNKISVQFMTKMGAIQCQLFPENAPKTVANFVLLAEGEIAWEHPQTKEKQKENYYDDTIFHRVLANQLIQGGDPSGLGTGGPGYVFPDERNRYRFDKGGRLAMANTGPNTNGSQFFITVNSKPEWDGLYTIFGQCDNLDVVKQISLVPVTDEDRPIDVVRLDKVVIERRK